jgi:hypothetical protein
MDTEKEASTAAETAGTKAAETAAAAELGKNPFSGETISEKEQPLNGDGAEAKAEEKTAEPEAGKKPDTAESKKASLPKAKDAAYAKLKREMKALEEKYAKAVEEKNDMAAEMAKRDYENKLGEEAALNVETFYEEAASEVADMDGFRFNAECFIPKLMQNPEMEGIIMSQEKPYAVMELLFDRMAANGVAPEELAKQAAPTLRKWIGALAEEISEKAKGADKAEESKKAEEGKKKIPDSIVPSTGNEDNATPVISDNASREQNLAHFIKHGAKGFKV